MTIVREEVEARLHQRETNELQRALLRNELVPEAADIARAILSKRGASIPTPMSDAVLEAERLNIRRQSNKQFLFFVATVVGWLVYALSQDLFSSSNGQRLQHSIFVTGLLIAAEFGWFKRRS